MAQVAWYITGDHEGDPVWALVSLCGAGKLLSWDMTQVPPEGHASKSHAKTQAAASHVSVLASPGEFAMQFCKDTRVESSCPFVSCKHL